MFEGVTTISDFLRVWLEHELLPPHEQKVLNDYYAGYRRRFPLRLQHYYRRQIQEAIELIRRTPRARVLEIGCGTGTESLWMAMHGARVEAVELGLDRFHVAKARKAVLERELGRRLDCEFVNRSLLDLDPADGYDLVWMEQAFHHLEPREEVAARVAGMLRPGGHVVISEANGLNPLLQMQLFSQRGFKTIGHYEDHTGRRHVYGDERVLPAGRLARLFERHGVEQVSIQHFRVFPNAPAFDGWLAVEQAAPQWLRPAFTHYNYVGRRAPSGTHP